MRYSWFFGVRPESKNDFSNMMIVKRTRKTSDKQPPHRHRARNHVRLVSAEQRDVFW